MMLGRRQPWLPQRVADFQFPSVLARQVLNNLKRVTRLTERLVRPRLKAIATSAHIWQINGACIAWLTLLLMSPIPATNPIPTIGILIFVVATLEMDGLMMCIGYGATALITAFFGVIAYGLWRSPQLIQQFFQWLQ
jgi:hypothetical protein